ncbi:DUF5808 domain-containing protein [Clostridium felsineum]|uniref:DUF5808 domain-containing protein n=1 Tax=Clostridium felsineum TaxID=36839 RepID=UPI00098CBA89|nr:DUF5808 domain-containing protein [Clostridium felsineum]URZ01917.1 hypothetical protein CLAUR_019140 [Clostridium felsineum]
METIIILIVGVIVLLCEIISFAACSHENGNIIFGVTLPNNQFKNKYIENSKNEYKTLYHKYFLISILIFLPILFLLKLPPYNIIYLLTWAFMVTFYLALKPYIIIHKKIKSLKKENSWFCGTTHEVTIDTKALTLKNKKVISIYWLIGSFLITLPCFYIVRTTFILIPIVDLTTKLILIFIYLYTKKLKTKIYSENSTVNVALNCERQRILTAAIIIFSYVDSLNVLVLSVIISNVQLYNTILLVSCSTIPPILILLLFIYYYNKFRKLKLDLLSKDDKAVIVDDDEYWKYGLIYYNPNDNSLLVEKRAGIGMTFNFAKKSARAFMYFIAAFLVGIIIFIFTMGLIQNSYSPTLNVYKNEIKINCSMYSTSFNKSNILKISLIQDTPHGFKTNGIGTDTYSRGHYDINDYGTSMVYVFNNKPPYIVFKLKDGSYVFFNYKSKSNTLRLYNKLKNKM